MAEHPLAGRRIVVTRPRRQSRALCEALESGGAEVISLPTFRIQAVRDSALERRLRRRGVVEADTVVFTSRNAVDCFFELAARAGARLPGTVEIAAVGPATAQALERHGVRADVTGAPHTAEGLLETMKRARGDFSGRRILYPKAADARETLERGLEALGALVEAETVYGAVAAPVEDPGAAEAALADAPDVITFASPSAAVHLEAALTPAVFGRVAEGLKTRSISACIGPVTARAVGELGYRVEVVAGTSTAGGLVDAIIDYFHKEP